MAAYKSLSLFPDRLTAGSAWHGHIPFAFWCVEVLRPRVVVELGAHRGDSYCAFLQAVEAFEVEATCYAIDTWRGDTHSGVYGPEILEELRAYHDPRYGRFSTLLQMQFDDALSYFSDASIDLLHIDGLHTYEAVRHDFESWLPKVSERGVILIHDVSVRERGFGAWRLWEELSAGYPCFALPHCHGLGVLTPGTERTALSDLLELPRDERARVAALFGALGGAVEVRGRIARLAVDLREARQEAERLLVMRRRMKEQHRAVVESRSWRWTAPLRMTMGAFRRAAAALQRGKRSRDEAALHE